MTAATSNRPPSTANMSAAMTGDTLEARRRRAIYRANYRGTKEMDWLLGKYGTAHVPAMTETELTAFELLLALPDPQLQGWLMTGEPPLEPPANPQHAPLVSAIRAYHKA